MTATILRELSIQKILFFESFGSTLQFPVSPKNVVPTSQIVAQNASSPPAPSPSSPSPASPGVSEDTPLPDTPLEETDEAFLISKEKSQKGSENPAILVSPSTESPEQPPRRWRATTTTEDPGIPLHKSPRGKRVRIGHKEGENSSEEKTTSPEFLSSDSGVPTDSAELARLSKLPRSASYRARGEVRPRITPSSFLKRSPTWDRSFSEKEKPSDKTPSSGSEQKDEHSPSPTSPTAPTSPTSPTTSPLAQSPPSDLQEAQSPSSGSLVNISGHSSPESLPSVEGFPKLTLSVVKTSETKVTLRWTVTTSNGKSNSVQVQSFALFIRKKKGPESDWMSYDCKQRRLVQMGEKNVSIPGDVFRCSVYGLDPETTYEANMRCAVKNKGWGPDLEQPLVLSTSSKGIFEMKKVKRRIKREKVDLSSPPHSPGSQIRTSSPSSMILVASSPPVSPSSPLCESPPALELSGEMNELTTKGALCDSQSLESVGLNELSPSLSKDSLQKRNESSSFSPVLPNSPEFPAQSQSNFCSSHSMSPARAASPRGKQQTISPPISPPSLPLPVSCSSPSVFSLAKPDIVAQSLTLIDFRFFSCHSRT